MIDHERIAARVVIPVLLVALVGMFILLDRRSGPQHPPQRTAVAIAPAVPCTAVAPSVNEPIVESTPLRRFRVMSKEGVMPNDWTHQKVAQSGRCDAAPPSVNGGGASDGAQPAGEYRAERAWNAETAPFTASHGMNDGDAPKDDASSKGVPIVTVNEESAWTAPASRVEVPRSISANAASSVPLNVVANTSINGSPSVTATLPNTDPCRNAPPWLRVHLVSALDGRCYEVGSSADVARVAQQEGVWKRTTNPTIANASIRTALASTRSLVASSVAPASSDITSSMTLQRRRLIRDIPGREWHHPLCLAGECYRTFGRPEGFADRDLTVDVLWLNAASDDAETRHDAVSVGRAASVDVTEPMRMADGSVFHICSQPQIRSVLLTWRDAATGAAVKGERVDTVVLDDGNGH